MSGPLFELGAFFGQYRPGNLVVDRHSPLKYESHKQVGKSRCVLDISLSNTTDSCYSRSSGQIWRHCSVACLRAPASVVLEGISSKEVTCSKTPDVHYHLDTRCLDAVYASSSKVTIHTPLMDVRQHMLALSTSCEVSFASSTIPI